MMRGLLAALVLLVCTIAQADDGFLRLAGHGGPVKGVAVSTDGKRALTASFDYSAALWDLETGQATFLYGHEAAANTVAFLPNNRALSAGDDFSLILWDLETATPMHRFQGHKGKIIHVSTDPSGRFAATSGWDGWVGVWDLKKLRHLHWMKGHRANVNATAFSADGAYLFSGSSDGTIRRWNTASGEIERVLVKHGFGINHLVLNDQSDWLAYGAVDGAVRALELKTDLELADLTADRRPILALTLNAKGDRLAVGDGEGYVMVIDTQRWSIERDFHAATRGPIWALAWAPDGRRLLSGGLDDAAALWPIEASDTKVAGVLSSGERGFLRPAAEMGNGERQFTRKCSICHTLTPDGAHRAGPTLWGVFGRRAGSVEGYAYSETLKTIGITWSAETINRLFDDGPDHYTPGSKMPMQRIAKATDRQDLIEFLAQNTGPHGTGD